MPFWKNSSTRSRRQRTEQNPKRHIIYGIVSFIFVALMVTALYYVARLNALTITTIDIEGGETISHNEVRAQAEKMLTGAYLLVIPYRFTYLYPHDRIVSVVNEIPRIHSVSVVRTAPTRLLISFNEYVPYALWCNDRTETSSCFFLDSSGYAFGPAPQLQGGVFVRHIVAHEDELAKKQVLSLETMSRTDYFVAQLKQKFDMRIGTIVHSEVQDETYVLNRGGEIRITDDAPIDEMLSDLESIFNSKEFKHLTPGNFNYIDLRFGNKIFVNDELIVAMPTDEQATSSLSE